MQSLKLLTSDNINIEANYYSTGHNEVLIIAPGWCMTKDSKVFKKIADCFAQYFDVISFDFRGHGKSGGRYTFTSKEPLDLEAIVDFAHKKYESIYIMGFSLGAAISLIFSSKSPLISKLIVVSPPCAFDKIENQMWRKEAWWETLKKFELKRFLSIRPSFSIQKKIKPIDIIDSLSVPALFIAGKKDPTVQYWHTEALYHKAKCHKAYKLFKNGIHAEDLFLHFNDEFTKVCVNWLQEQTTNNSFELLESEF